MSPARTWLTSSQLRFLVVGGFNTLLGLAIIYTLKLAIGLQDVPANVTGYAIGLTVSYLLHARWTFQYRGSLKNAVHRYVITVITAYLANLFVVVTSINFFGINSYLAHAIGIVPYACVMYLMSRYYVFRLRNRRFNE